MDPLQQLEDLAAAAETHAREEHGIELADVAAAQRVLEKEAGLIDPRRIEFLAASYGAWLGRLAIRRWRAAWVGLSEPVAPRLEIHGVLVSPIDAVRRSLRDPGAPSLTDIAGRLEDWSRDAAGPDGNREAWDLLASDTRFAGSETLPRDAASARDWLDGWVRSEGVEGKSLLCLGAGGGRQGPLHAMAGARVTVVDFSERQLDHDRHAAAALKLDLRALCASIEDLHELASASFDIVVQPVSACYVRDLGRVYAEVARVLRPRGLYVVQHKQPANLQSGPDLRLVEPCVEGRALPPSGTDQREPGTTEYVHRLDALLGGLCRAGFVLEDVVEPPRADALAPEGSPGRRAWFLPPYLKIKARRV